METGWNSVSGGRGQSSNCTTNIACDMWQLGSTTTTTTTSRYDYWINTDNSFPHLPTATTTTSTLTLGEASALNALVHHPSNGLYAGAGTHFNPPDPHLMCLKLGKRHYFEDAIPLGDRHVAASASVSKRAKMGYYGYGPVMGGSSTGAAPPVPVPRCQVQGCQAALLNAKEYHRRHKVCEMHSKAPKVLVHGIEQRFCQQCSRFHEVSEFDESKRSCRRRLAGHNERRRKSSHDHSLSRNPPQENKLMTDTFSHLSAPAGCALSLLSSNNEPWIFSSDLSSRCSIALGELIAENRASILGKQFIIDKEYCRRNNHTIESFSENQSSNSSHPDHHQILHDSQIWDRFNESDTNVTLNLAPTSAFELLSMREKSSKDTDECSDFWSSLGGTHVV